MKRLLIWLAGSNVPQNTDQWKTGMFAEAEKCSDAFWWDFCGTPATGQAAGEER